MGCGIQTTSIFNTQTDIHRKSQIPCKRKNVTKDIYSFTFNPYWFKLVSKLRSAFCVIPQRKGKKTIELRRFNTVYMCFSSVKCSWKEEIEEKIMKGSIDRIITGSDIGSGGDVTSWHIHDQNLLLLVKKPWNVANFLYMQANYIRLNKKWRRGRENVPRMLPVVLFLS